MSVRVVGWSLVIGLFTVACGGAAVPTESVTSTTAAVRAAEVGGAPGNPEAALLLKKAREGLTKAKAQIADGDNEAAAFTLDRAEADAELALFMAREAAAKAEAQAAMDQVKSFKQKASE